MEATEQILPVGSLLRVRKWGTRVYSQVPLTFTVVPKMISACLLTLSVNISGALPLFTPLSGVRVAN